MLRDLFGRRVAIGVDEQELLRLALAGADHLGRDLCNGEARVDVGHAHLVDHVTRSRRTAERARSTLGERERNEVFLVRQTHLGAAQVEATLRAVLVLLDREEVRAGLEDIRSTDRAQVDVLLHFAQRHRMREAQRGGDLVLLGCFRVRVELKVRPRRRDRADVEGVARLVFKLHFLGELGGIERDRELRARRPIGAGLERQQLVRFPQPAAWMRRRKRDARQVWCFDLIETRGGGRELQRDAIGHRSAFDDLRDVRREIRDRCLARFHELSRLRLVRLPPFIAFDVTAEGGADEDNRRGPSARMSLHRIEDRPRPRRR